MDRRLLRSLVPPRERLGPDHGHDDASLLDRFADSRDERAFEELLTRHGPTVWGVCRRTLPRREDAEDAFQASFVALMRLAESGKRPRNLAGWLVRVAGRISLNVRREAGRSRRRQAAVARPEPAAPVAEATYDAAYAALREEIESLPEGLRAAYLLCELGGTPQPLAAVQLGLKPSALSARLSRARQRLESRLAARGLAPGIATVVLAGTATTLGAMPTRVVMLVQSLAAPSVIVPTTLTALAATGVPAVISKLKLLTFGAVALTAAGLTLGAGAGLMPGAAAQVEKADPQPPQPKPPSTKALEEGTFEFERAREHYARAVSQLAASRAAEGKVPAFEYRFHDYPATRDEFKKLLRAEAVEGFEFAGATAAFSPAAENGPLVVFKRLNPKAAPPRPAPPTLPLPVPFADPPAAPTEVRPGGKLQEAREAVAAAQKFAALVEARLQEAFKQEAANRGPALLSPIGAVSLLAKAETSLEADTAVAIATARIYLDEANDSLKGARGAEGMVELRIAVRLALEAVKRAEADGERRDPLFSERRPAVDLPTRLSAPTVPPPPAEGNFIYPSDASPLARPALPPVPANPLEAEVAKLRAELDAARRELEAQKAKPVARRVAKWTASTCTPFQATCVVEALKPLGVTDISFEPKPSSGLTALTLYNPRPGDVQLAEAMIRTVTGTATDPDPTPEPPRVELPEPTPAVPPVRLIPATIPPHPPEKP